MEFGHGGFEAPGCAPSAPGRTQADGKDSAKRRRECGEWVRTSQGVDRVYLVSCPTAAVVRRCPAHLARRDWRRCLHVRVSELGRGSSKGRVSRGDAARRGPARQRKDLHSIRWCCKRTWRPIGAKTPNLAPNGRRQWQCCVAPHDGEDQENLGTPGGHPRPLGRGRPSAGGATPSRTLRLNLALHCATTTRDPWPPSVLS